MSISTSSQNPSKKIGIYAAGSLFSYIMVMVNPARKGYLYGMLAPIHCLGPQSP